MVAQYEPRIACWSCTSSSCQWKIQFKKSEKYTLKNQRNSYACGGTVDQGLHATTVAGVAIEL